MTFDEARSEAVQGARITSGSIQLGAYVDYQFNGLRIVYPSGSSSGFRATPDDYAADWRIVDELLPRCRSVADPRDVWGNPVTRDKWGRPL